MADPLSITTAIITLSNTLERAINLVNDIQDAPQKLLDIKADCNVTKEILRSIRRHLRATEAVLPTLHIYGNDDQSAGFSLANLLSDNVDQLQLDLDSLVEELGRLDRSGDSESRIYGWVNRGVLGFRMPYLVGMQKKIVTKRGQLQLVQSSLQIEVDSRLTLERRASHDEMATMLIGMLRLFDPSSNIIPLARRLSTASGASSPRSRGGRERLMRAVKKGNRQDVESILGNGWTDPNFLDDQDGLSPLCVAAIKGDLAMIEVLLQNGALVDWCSRDSTSPLMFALLYSHPVAALGLIRRGANISHTDARHASALHFAVHRNFYAVVQVLLRNGADPNIRDADGRTALREAVSRDDRDIQPNDTSVLLSLLEHSNEKAADPLIGTHEHGYNPVHHAARNGFLADLKLLTDPKYSIDSDFPAHSKADFEGHTPLWFAAHSGHIDIIRYLLDTHQSDPNVSSSDNDFPTALWAIAFCKHTSYETICKGAEALLAANADPNKRNSHQQTLLHRLASTDNTALMSLLLSHRANPLLTDTEGRTPLHYAAASGREDVLDALFQSKSFTLQSNATDDEKRTPLMLAAAAGHDYIVKALIDGHGEGWAERDINGCDAFYLACAWGHLLTAAYLLGKGVKIDEVNTRGNTALHGAVRMERIQVVRWLLRMGADPGIRSQDAFEGLGVKGTPADVARAIGGSVGEEMANFLEAWESRGKAGRRKERWTTCALVEINR